MPCKECITLLRLELVFNFRKKKFKTDWIRKILL